MFNVRWAAATLVIVVGSLSPTATAADSETAGLHEILLSDASRQEKGIACRRLAVIGSPASIPILAKLLSDDQLSHLARFALEANPAAEVDRLFRDSLETMTGTPRVGVINSIGVRQDVAAVPRLIRFLDRSNSPTEAAAAAALAQIASNAAIRAVLQRLNARADVAIADACLTAAQRLADLDQLERANEVLDELLRAELSPPIRTAAMYAALRARRSADLALLQEQLRSDDDALFATALQAVRDMPAADLSPLLLAEGTRQPPPRQALLITALADLGVTEALPLLRDATQSDSPVVRVAALRGLRQLGTHREVDLLLEAAGGENPVEAAAARKTLEGLAGSEVDQAIAARLAKKASPHYPLLIALAGSRRIVSTVPDLLIAAASRESSLRLAAVQALGETVSRGEIDQLLEMLVAEQQPEARTVIAAALTAACIRMPDREGTVEHVVGRLSQTSPEMVAVQFELLRDVGGRAALQHVVAGARDKRDAVQDAATRVLGEWYTVDVAPELLDLARTLESSKYQIRALRGYIRVIRQFGLPLEERLAMARQALQVCQRNEEKILVLHTLVRFPAPESQALAMEYFTEPGLRLTAAHMAVGIAERLTELSPQTIDTVQQIFDSRVDPRLDVRIKAVLGKAAGSAPRDE